MFIRAGAFTRINTVVISIYYFNCDIVIKL